MPTINAVSNQNLIPRLQQESKVDMQQVASTGTATRVSGQNEDNLINLATAQTQSAADSDQQFSHQRHIAYSAYVNYGRETPVDTSFTTANSETQEEMIAQATAQMRETIFGDGESDSSSQSTGESNTATTNQAVSGTTTGGDDSSESSIVPETPAIQSKGVSEDVADAVKGSDSEDGAGDAAKTSGESQATSATSEKLTEEEQAEVEDLKARDQEVRTHEQAHKSAGGQYAAAPTYTYERGPDGKQYVTDGEVSIDIGEESDPQATINKMQVVKRAAMAPAQPSAQDRRVYAEATQKEAQARQELNEQKAEEAQGGEGENSAAPTASKGTESEGNSAINAKGDESESNTINGNSNGTAPANGAKSDNSTGAVNNDISTPKVPSGNFTQTQRQRRW